MYLHELVNNLLRNVEDHTALRIIREAYDKAFPNSSDWKPFAIRTLSLRKSLITKLSNERKNPSRRNEDL